MLSLESAKDLGFQTSTLIELRSYCDELGIKYDGRHKDKSLISLLCTELGMINTAVPEAKRIVLKVSGKGEVTPPYNLRPSGIWEGRRHRVRLMRPNGVKIEAGKMFSWNGKKYAVPYDEVSNIPEPIFNILRDTRKTQARNVPVDMGDGLIERHTQFFEVGEAFPHQYLGVDPETKGRAGSLKEWYMNKGPSWFRARSQRELAQIAQLCDISTRNEHKEALSESELCDALMVFFFSYADAESAELVAA